MHVRTHAHTHTTDKKMKLFSPGAYADVHTCREKYLTDIDADMDNHFEQTEHRL